MNQEVIETHPLAPFLPLNGKLLMLGSFPPPKTRWKMDFYYPNFQNDMWKIFGLCFFQDKNYFLNVETKTFKEQQIRNFLNEKGMGIFDTAYQVIRLKGNASDKFLQIHTPTNIEMLLNQMPECHNIMTTGDKATDTLMLSMPEATEKPKIGHSVKVDFFRPFCKSRLFRERLNIVSDAIFVTCLSTSFRKKSRSLSCFIFRNRLTLSYLLIAFFVWHYFGIF